MDTEKLYQERLRRYVAAMRHEQPDMIPIRPFVAEFTAKYAGYTCQEVTHDFEKAFEAARICARDFDWDAIVPNMVYVWTGLTQAMGLRYYGIPGIGMPPDTGFNYIEPPEDEAFMRADEYDALIEDPTGFLYNVWFPRVCAEACRIGDPCTYRNNLAYVKGGMAMLHYFHSFGRQIALMRSECGTPSAIAGIFKAPFDIIADKLRGYVGLTMDMHEQPDKVLKACEALAPHLCHVGLTTADPEKKLPIGFWMHRGCVPFITPAQFKSHYWPTLKPIIEEFWKNGYQTLFYAEGNWNAHLDDFATLPERSMVYHVDRADIFEVHRKLGHRFCLSGGIPNVLLSYGKPEEVRQFCRKVAQEVARDGGYIADASAIMQNDTSIENMRAFTQAFREYGQYSGPAYTPSLPEPHRDDPSRQGLRGLEGWPVTRRRPGVCLPWEDKVKELPEITGDAELVKRIWEMTDSFGNLFIWQVLLSF
ncbi:uroporphyrinogen decarboxylase family protein [Fontisphaera persica]|uniref:uroporphyrinogen decarboxylase family protein n=1 Tax=Fontisphaera persica TaxID=2974023 RepID=UPI0024BF3364|nr:uroporphyrinogen decarboxylase family protein [Fontisphaera persica]WCJ60466.1 uroporphyrinogen decarboxylase family protein [Fontisphaera persica]